MRQILLTGLALLALLTGCTFSSGETATKLSLDLRGESLDDFDCFFANVSGAQIAPAFGKLEGGVSAECLGFGLTSSLFKSTDYAETPLKMKVPTGPARTFQIVGVKGVAACAGKSTVNDLFADGGVPKLNIVSTTTVDVYKDLQVTLTNDYVSGKASDLVPACQALPSPIVTGIVPNTGPVAGGTTVTISGTYFRFPLSISLAGTLCTDVQEVSPTEAKCITAARVYGTGDVAVKNTDGASGLLPNGFTYLGELLVTGVAPPGAGSVLGGNTVTINGIGFVDGATATVGPNPCTDPVVLSQTALTCMVPPGALGLADVTVTNPFGSSPATFFSLYKYNPVMNLSSISPADFGPVGGLNTVTINGSDILNISSVTFDGLNCGDVFASASSIQCKVPPHSLGTVAVVVTAEDGQIKSVPGGYTYTDPPTVTGVSPSFGPVGGSQLVEVNGTGFRPGLSITFAGAPCTAPTYIDSTRASCITPNAAVEIVAAVVVTNADGQPGSKSDGFVFTDPPTVTGAVPNLGSTDGGTLISITGTKFQAGASVMLASTPCLSVNVLNSGTLTCITSPRVSGGTTITVTNLDTQFGNSSPGAFTYTDPPVITSVAPLSPPMNINVPDTLGGNGNNFAGPLTITLRGTVDCPQGAITSTAFNCSAPALAGGYVDVTVANNDGVAGTLYNAFRVGPADQWYPTAIPNAPGDRRNFTASPLGEARVAVWGGTDLTLPYGNGAVYNANRDTWTAMSATNAPSPRYNHSAVWTGTQKTLLIWGGRNQSAVLNDGGKFDPLTNSWSAISTTNAPLPRARHGAAWTGSEMVVFGGYNDFESSFPVDFQKYNPVSNTWATGASPAGFLTGRYYHTMLNENGKVVVFGGRNVGGVFGDGALYDYGLNTWAAMSMTDAPSPRYLHSAVSSGLNLIIVFGGLTSGEVALNDGGRFIPSTNQWAGAALATSGAPTPRFAHSAVYTGSKMLIWGGRSASVLGDGASYSSFRNSWTPLNSTGAPPARSHAPAVWTGGVTGEMFVWGGESDVGLLGTGGHYVP